MQVTFDFDEGAGTPEVSLAKKRGGRSKGVAVSRAVVRRAKAMGGAYAVSPPRKSIAAEALLAELGQMAEPGRVPEGGKYRRELDALPVFVGEFWTAKQRSGHSLHEVSYRACFKSQLPAFFIERLTRPGDRVYDPFMGRGTTLLEAYLRGRGVAGNDANPLSRALIAPRLDPPSLAEVEARLAEVPLPRVLEETEGHELLVFFAPETLSELFGWRRYFQERRERGLFDRVDGWIQMVACGRLTGHSKGFFSVYTLPPNQATYVEAQRKINEKRGQTPEYRDTRALILRKSRQLLRDPLPQREGIADPLLVCSSADDTPAIPDASVQLVVTSPPFLDVVDYIGDNWMRNWFCMMAPEKQKLWQLKKIDQWKAAMRDTFAELHRVLKPGGHVAFEVGEVRGGSVGLVMESAEAALEAGLEPACIMINSQRFTKTSQCWGVDNNSLGTNSNRILVARRPAL